jgi:hypothetical protein
MTRGQAAEKTATGGYATRLPTASRACCAIGHGPTRRRRDSSRNLPAAGSTAKICSPIIRSARTTIGVHCLRLCDAALERGFYRRDRPKSSVWIWKPACLGCVYVASYWS